MDGLEHYPVDRELGRYAGLLKNEWAKQGRTLSIPDVIIAATALAYKLVLMTDNRKDFPMPQLAIFPLPESQMNAMDSEKEPNPESPARGYQPTTGRKLFMFILCLVALIAVWVFYWLAPK